MRRRREFKNQLLAGEVSPDYYEASNDELAATALKQQRNAIGINAGGSVRRPGTYMISDITVDKRFEQLDLDTGGYVIAAFYDGYVDILDPDDGSVIDTVAGPWSTSSVKTMQVANGENLMWIYSNDFHPQVLRHDGGGSYSVGDETFSGGTGGSISQPYYRYAARGISLTPGATSGTGISLVFSEDFLTDDHIGTRIRYVDNEIEVKTVTDAQNGTGDVISALYPTLRVTVASVAPFKVDHRVNGTITGVSGVVIAVGAGTVDVVLISGYSHFDATSPEKLRSPNGESAISAVTTISPGETVLWDEQMISDARGYPGAVCKHRNRKFIGGFPDAPSAIVMSAAGFPDDYDLGDGDVADASIELLGDNENAQIRHIVSAEQLIIGTDRACYYVPESEQAPIVPGGVEFKKISPDSMSEVPPLVVPEGVVFTDNADRLLILSPTGNVRASWVVGELSNLSDHLLTDPVELAYLPGLGTRRERFLLVRNDDGTIVVFSYRRNSDQLGAALWSVYGDGRFGYICAV